jgi:hypothetical protein
MEAGGDAVAQENPAGTRQSDQEDRHSRMISKQQAAWFVDSSTLEPGPKARPSLRLDEAQNRLRENTIELHRLRGRVGLRRFHNLLRTSSGGGTRTHNLSVNSRAHLPVELPRIGLPRTDRDARPHSRRASSPLARLVMPASTSA